MEWSDRCLCCVISVALFGTLLYTASISAYSIPEGDKVKDAGLILSRNGDTVLMKDRKAGQVVVVNITDNTKIDRKRGRLPFYRHTEMDVTAMLPGLTIEAEGRGDSKGRLNAEKISFSPDEFAVAVAEQQEVIANREAVKKADSAAQQGIAAAVQAQSSANQAMVSASQADAQAQTAGAVSIADAIGVSTLNKRVSELNDYKNEFEVDVFFAWDSAVLDEKARKDLDNLADIAKSLDGYLVEGAGYTSNTLSKESDQRLSEERVIRLSATRTHMIASLIGT